MSSDIYPFQGMTLLGHKERLTWLIGTHDRINNVVNYAEEQAAKHQFAGQDARYIQSLVLELINFHKKEIARLEEEAQRAFTIPTVDEAVEQGKITQEEADALLENEELDQT
jgi:hypothetical protein